MIELLCLSVGKTIGKLKQGSLNNKIARANAQCMQEIVPKNFLLELPQLPSLVSVQSQSKVRFIEFQDPKRKGGFLFVNSYQVLQTSRILYFPSCPSFLSIQQVYHASCIVPQTPLLTVGGHARSCILLISVFLSALSYA